MIVQIKLKAIFYSKERATCKFSFVASWRATASNSGELKVRATSRMASSVGLFNAAANSSRLDAVKAISSSSGLAF